MNYSPAPDDNKQLSTLGGTNLRDYFAIAESSNFTSKREQFGLRPEINEYDVRGAMGCGCTVAVPSKCTQKSC